MLTSCFFFNEIVYIIGSLSRKKLEIHFCDKSQKFITLSSTECFIETFFGRDRVNVWLQSHQNLIRIPFSSKPLCNPEQLTVSVQISEFLSAILFFSNNKNSMYFYRIYYISDLTVSISCFLTHRIPSPNMILFSQSLTHIRHCSGNILFHLEIKY